jgi:C4-dicarboxylate transporter, DctM subunit
MAMVETKVYDTGRNYTLSVVPLFILMGNFVTRAGMSQELFRAAFAFVGHLRGGLAMATICACAGFGAICGSSIATTATWQRSLSFYEGARLFRPAVDRRDRIGRHARNA